MTFKILISDFQESDLTPLQDIYNHIISSTNAIYRENIFTDEEWKIWVKTRLDHNFPILVAREATNHIPVGFATYTHFRAAQGYRYSYEHSVHVSEKYRGQKIGERLMSLIIDRAKAQNGHLLIGAIDAENQGSIHFHEKFEFTISGRIPEVACLHGKWHEVVFMHKILS